MGQPLLGEDSLRWRGHRLSPRGAGPCRCFPISPQDGAAGPEMGGWKQLEEALLAPLVPAGRKGRRKYRRSFRSVFFGSPCLAEPQAARVGVWTSVPLRRLRPRPPTWLVRGGTVEGGGKPWRAVAWAGREQLGRKFCVRALAGRRGGVCGWQLGCTGSGLFLSFPLQNAGLRPEANCRVWARGVLRVLGDTPAWGWA